MCMREFIHNIVLYSFVSEYMEHRYSMQCSYVKLDVKLLSMKPCPSDG